jgi:bifunctional DNA-binding transcriptional regulator/antitoxin component of YhaV-PrlF toxin-antitoxin module
VTGTLIAPVIPSPAAAAGRPARAPAAARTLPLAVPPAQSRPPAIGRDVVYGLARIDRSGRVADRTVTGALGWRGGDRLTLTAEAGVVVIRRDPSGLITLPPRSCVPIPAALRHRCGLLPGDPVLLAAVPAEDTLTAYSLAVVDQALRALIPFPARDGGDR